MPDLSPDEILNILCALNNRIDTLNETMLLLVDKVSEQLNFQDTEIIKARMEGMTYGIKTPRQRIDSLEKSFKGLVQFVTSKEKSIKDTNKEAF
jgi:ADP-dependent phosphofructokinase/glucokinase